MKVALIGASGNVGSRIAHELTTRGHDVTGIARNADNIAAGSVARTVETDIADPAALGQASQGHDAIIVSVKYQGLDVDTLLDGLRRSGVKRVLFVGGAASLEVSPGVQLIDTPGFPDFIKVEAESARVALARIRAVQDLDWSFLSPAIMLVPGERTGKFRVGGDQLLKDDAGESKISMEDLAVALVDELEHPKHIRRRFSVVY